MVVCVAFGLSACATPGGEARINPKLCAALLGLAGGAGGNAVGIHNDRDDEDDRLGYIGVGAVAGAALGYVLCNAYRTEAMAPEVRVSASPTEGTAPLAVEFRSTASDPDGKIVSYEWEFGDGTRTTGPRGVRHSYPSPGKYTARLKVTDDKGLSASDDVSIRVAEAAAPEEPPRVVRRIVLRGVQFDFDKAVIRPNAEVILDAAAEVLKENRDVQAEVAGHTDSLGSEAYNEDLSRRRAGAVADYLASQGIAARRLSTVGYGESSPVASNETEEGRAQNRRVEFNILE